MNNLGLLRFEIVVSAKYSYKLNEYVIFGVSFANWFVTLLVNCLGVKLLNRNERYCASADSIISIIIIIIYLFIIIIYSKTLFIFKV